MVYAAAFRVPATIITLDFFVEIVVCVCALVLNFNLYLLGEMPNRSVGW